MAAQRFTTPEEYFRSFDEIKAQTMRNILAVIEKNFPEATVKIAWNVPQIQLSGKYVFGIAAAKNHISLSPWSHEVMAKEIERLAPYEPTKALFRVPVDWDVDEALITDLIKGRIAEL